MKKAINTPDAPKPIGAYSQAIMAGNTLYVSGQIPINLQSGTVVEGGAGEQAKQVMENISAILKEAGMGLDKVAKCSIFLSDMTLFKEVNEVYGTYFTTMPPAREAIAVKGLPMGVDVEISCIAVQE
ncbi:MAG: RidA family protein [Bacteroidales bacterium]|nr:RidA family protein [Bacteroidales bacterium]